MRPKFPTRHLRVLAQDTSVPRLRAAVISQSGPCLRTPGRHRRRETRKKLRDGLPDRRAGGTSLMTVSVRRHLRLREPHVHLRPPPRPPRCFAAPLIAARRTAQAHRHCDCAGPVRPDGARHQSRCRRAGCPNRVRGPAALQHPGRAAGTGPAQPGRLGQPVAELHRCADRWTHHRRAGRRLHRGRRTRRGVGRQWLAGRSTADRRLRVAPGARGGDQPGRSRCLAAANGKSHRAGRTPRRYQRHRQLYRACGQHRPWRAAPEGHPAVDQRGHPPTDGRAEHHLGLRRAGQHHRHHHRAEPARRQIHLCARFRHHHRAVRRRAAQSRHVWPRQQLQRQHGHLRPCRSAARRRRPAAGRGQPQRCGEPGA